jgi:hypothetical protein
LCGSSGRTTVGTSRMGHWERFALRSKSRLDFARRIPSTEKPAPLGSSRKRTMLGVQLASFASRWKRPRKTGPGRCPDAAPSGDVYGSVPSHTR